MSAQTTADETSRFEQLQADLKMPSGDLTIAFPGQHSGENQSLEFNNQISLLFSTWPQRAFELAKAALLSQQCSAAEALEAVTRSGGRGGQAEA